MSVEWILLTGVLAALFVCAAAIAYGLGYLRGRFAYDDRRRRLRELDAAPSPPAAWRGQSFIDDLDP